MGLAGYPRYTVGWLAVEVLHRRVEVLAPTGLESRIREVDLLSIGIEVAGTAPEAD